MRFLIVRLLSRRARLALGSRVLCEHDAIGVPYWRLLLDATAHTGLGIGMEPSFSFADGPACNLYHVSCGAMAVALVEEPSPLLYPDTAWAPDEYRQKEQYT
jgi:hypothetical protein